MAIDVTGYKAIALIESCGELRKSYTDILEVIPGVSVTSFTNNEEALAKIVEINGFDLIVMCVDKGAEALALTSISFIRKIRAYGRDYQIVTYSTTAATLAEYSDMPNVQTHYTQHPADDTTYATMKDLVDRVLDRKEIKTNISKVFYDVKQIKNYVETSSKEIAHLNMNMGEIMTGMAKLENSIFGKEQFQKLITECIDEYKRTESTEEEEPEVCVVPQGQVLARSDSEVLLIKTERMFQALADTRLLKVLIVLGVLALAYPVIPIKSGFNAVISVLTGVPLIKAVPAKTTPPKKAS